MHIIRQRNERELYRLSASRNEAGEPQLCVKLTQDAAQALSEIPHNAPIVRELQKHRDIEGTFCNDVRIGGSFGFTHGLFPACPIYQHDRDRSALKLTARLPIVERPNPDHEPTIVQTEAFTITTTLSLLYQALSYYRDMDDSCIRGPYQLYHVLTMCRRDMNGSALSCTFSPFMTQHLRANCDRIDTKQIWLTMRDAWRYMMSTRGLEHDEISFEETQLRVELRENGGFFASCPGEATGLHQSLMDHSSEEYGLDISSHNVDSPAQQLTLLMAIAALSDQVPDGA